MNTITYDEALEKLRELVAERGEDYVYRLEERIDRVLDWVKKHPPESYKRPAVFRDGVQAAFSSVACSYLEYEEEPWSEEVSLGRATPTGPSCGVGYVYWNLVPGSEQELQDSEGQGAEEVYETMHQVYGLSMSEPTAELLGQFQYFQDQGYPYGVALERAIEMAERVARDA